MNQEQKPYEGSSVPENYNRYLVPLIFEDYAADLVSRLDVPPSGEVLETACGTGVVTRHLVARLSGKARLTVTDLSPQMVEFAQQATGDHAEILFQKADATKLPFSDGSFDAVVCQFGAMLFPDIPQGYREAARVLRAGGQFVFNVWDSLDRNGFSRAVHEAAGKMYPDNPPRFLEIPYSYNNLSQIVSDLQEAGFADVNISVQLRESKAPEPRHVALGLVAGSPLANQIMDCGSLSLSEAVDAIEKAILKEFGSGPVSAPMQAFQISGNLPSS